MTHIRSWTVVVAAFGLMMASISPVAAGGPDHDQKSSRDQEREGSKQGQSYHHRDRDKDDHSQASNNKSDRDHDDDRNDHRDGKSHEKVTICHRTGSASNPFVKITIAKAGMNGHDGHDDLIVAAGTDCPTATPTPVATQAVNNNNNDDDKDCWKWDSSHVAWTKSDVEHIKMHQVSYAFVQPQAKVIYIVQPVVIQPVVVGLTEDATLTAGAQSAAISNDTSASFTEAMTATTAVEAGTTPVLTLAPSGVTDPLTTAAVAGAMDAAPATTGTAGTDAQQVVPANAGNGVGVADAAMSTLLGLSVLAMAVVFGSRWLTAKR